MNILHIQYVEREDEGGTRENLISACQRMKGQIAHYIEPIRELEDAKGKCWVADVYMIDRPKAYQKAEVFHKIQGWEVEKIQSFSRGTE